MTTAPLATDPSDADRHIPNGPADAAFARGLSAHRRGDISLAIAAYDEALAVAPEMTAALINKGAALRAKGQLPEAMACYWRALAVDGDNALAWCNAGNALAQSGRTREARSMLEIALQKGPRIGGAWSAMADLLLRQRHFAAAEACLRRAVALAPGDRLAGERLAELLRRDRGADLPTAPIDPIIAALESLVASPPLPIDSTADIVVHSIFGKDSHHGDTEKKEDEILPALPANNSSPCLRGANDLSPRFRMTVPRSYLADPGLNFLVTRERSGVGYEYATRSFLDAHLRPGDLFIDVGAHWGIMSLQAATRWPEDIDVLAIEPLAGNLPHLHRWIDDNGRSQRIEVIAAAASDAPGRGRLKPESTMGHSLIKAEAGPVAVITVDQLLADRPHLQQRRIIVKIDVEGSEIDVVRGMAGLLDSGRVAAVIWERGIDYDRPAGQKRQAELRRLFDDHRFSAWHFLSEDDAGRLAPFDTAAADWHGNVFELAADQAPIASYGLPRPAPLAQPDDPALDASLEAYRAFHLGLAAQKAGKGREAAGYYSQAASIEPTVPGLYNNLGVLLRETGRLTAAATSYRRALATAPDDVGVLSNLGNVLREQGDFAKATALQERALCLQPANASLHYNAGVTQKDAGRPERALILFERALRLAPDNADYRWDRALALLQCGNYGEGFPAYEARWGLRRAHKRKIALPAWDGSPLDGRAIFLSDEQGFGDVLQFARFIPEVKRRGAGRIVVECQPELMRLMALTRDVDAVVPREKNTPATDVYAPLLSLPAIVGTTLDRLPADVPYLSAPPPTRLLPDDGRIKLGLVWAGKPTPRDRSCPLPLLLPLLGDPRLAPYSLQIGPRAGDLVASGADALVTDLGPALRDFAETAAMLRQLDLLVTVDTAVAHLAGALGLPTFLLLRHSSDWRWFDRGTTSPWYPSFTLFRQKAPLRWDEALSDLGSALAAFEKIG
ncbi:FkbM family methyltransferase [Telmatospirillum sp.]|uniref:FkbM family methyltransferase n=1 Tax=Telmatospirillum sp. TaxID=2079197 RepID=UPI00283D0080|nr:FkbM family methyltransferase [Telmatospirillum sp.]MDR3436483.1 FkbM family methyltransferase [Telmatospirillum sp.]